MKALLTEVLLEYYDRELPEVMPRSLVLPELERNATIVTGMRRSGKTFLLYQRIEELKRSGLSADRILYLNFDDDRLGGLQGSDLRLIPDIYYALYPSNRDRLCYFFLDEIQAVESWEPFVRRLIDSGKIQVYLTGSSSKLLSRDIATSMRGRSIEVEVLPFSFEEYLRFHNLLPSIPTALSPRTQSILQHAFQEYRESGGFPDAQRVDPVLRTQLLQGYAQEVMFHDIVERYAISNLPALRFILRRTAHNPGGKLSVNALCKDLHSVGISCDRASLSEYIHHFCEAYFLYEVPLYTESLQREKVNPAKYYTADVGLVRAMSTKRSTDEGALLENLVYLHLRRNHYHVKYLVTSKGYEVDFVATHPITKEIKLLQVCYDLSQEATREREMRALRDVQNTLQASEAFLVTQDIDHPQESEFPILPAWKFLLNPI